MKLVTDLKLTVWKRLRCKLSSRLRPTVLKNGTSRACMFLHLPNNCEYGIITKNLSLKFLLLINIYKIYVYSRHLKFFLFNLNLNYSNLI